MGDPVEDKVADMMNAMKSNNQAWFMSNVAPEGFPSLMAMAQGGQAQGQMTGHEIVERSKEGDADVTKIKVSGTGGEGFITVTWKNVGGQLKAAKFARS